MLNFFKKKKTFNDNDFVLNDENQWKINYILIMFNNTFNWQLYDKEKQNIPEKDYNLFMEIRQSWKEVQEILDELLELANKYPNWSYLIYEIWYSYALIWNIGKAKIYYDKLSKLEERWFYNSITEKFIIEEIISKDLDVSIFSKYLSLYDTPNWSVLEMECEKFINEYSNFPQVYVLYILSLMINRKLDKIDNVINICRDLEKDADTNAKLKALEFLYNLLKWKRDTDILNWIYSLTTSKSIDSLADYIVFTIK